VLADVPVEQVGPLQYVVDRGRTGCVPGEAEKVVDRSVLDVARRLGLVAPRGEHLFSTAEGRRAGASQTALAAAFARSWIGRRAEVEDTVRELTVALLLAGTGTVAHLVEEVVGLLDESGWRRGDRARLTEAEVEPMVLEAWEELLDLGLLERPGWTLVLARGTRPLLQECLRQRLSHIDLPSPRLC
jgi:hypothetical protein